MADPTELALEQMAAELAAEEERLATAAAAREAAALSPEARMLEARIRLDEVRRARAAEEQALVDEDAIRLLRAKHGPRLAVIYTAAGSLVLTWTRGHEAHWNRIEARAKDVAQALLEQPKPDEARATAESLKAYREGYLDHIIAYPEKAKARAILEEYPDTWNDVFALRAELARGPMAAAGKGAGR